MTLWVLLVLTPFVSQSATPTHRLDTDQQEHIVVARVENGGRSSTAGHLFVISEGQSAAARMQDYSQSPKGIGVVLDAGPNQRLVFSREKELAVSLVNALSGYRTNFTIVRAGFEGKLYPTTSEPTVAIDFIQDIVPEMGRKSDIPIYDSIGLAIRELSVRPGIRIVIFIGEGNDFGSRLGFNDLRNMAEALHVTCSVVLLADHSLRGTKSVLLYGWDLRELAEDTAGIFTENKKSYGAVRQLAEKIRALRLITFDMHFRNPGRHRISISSKPRLKLHAQKAIVVGTEN